MMIDNKVTENWHSIKIHAIKISTELIPRLMIFVENLAFLNKEVQNLTCNNPIGHTALDRFCYIFSKHTALTKSFIYGYTSHNQPLSFALFSIFPTTDPETTQIFDAWLKQGTKMELTSIKSQKQNMGNWNSLSYD